MDDLLRFCCQNSHCPDYGKRAAGNLTVSFRYGKQPWRMLYCSSYKARFSERKGSALFGLHLRDALAIQAFEHIVEGCGIRATSRLVPIHRNTAARLSRRAGGQAKALHDELMAFSPSNRQNPV